LSLTVSRILHAGYILQSQDQQIAIDPIFESPFSVNCFSYPPVEFDQGQIRKLNLAAVFISHFHDDHCSLRSLNLIDRKTPIYMFCVHQEMFDWIRALGFNSVHSLQHDVRIEVGGFGITPRKAEDLEVDCLLQIQVENLNILNVVDSWIDDSTLEQLKALAPWDLVMWPFQKMQELRMLSPGRVPPASTEFPAEWTAQIKALNPRCVIPSSCQFIQEHWSWQRFHFFPISYKSFADHLKLNLPQCQVLRLDPGESATFRNDFFRQDKSLNWIQPLTEGPSLLDYPYEPERIPDTTADIARNWSDLEDFKNQRVLHFCQNEVLNRYQELDTDSDSYFCKNRVWCLKLHSKFLEPVVVYYQVQKNRISLLAEIPNEIDWLTELPQVKLFSALEEGETLSSLYIRINDHTFSQKIEAELQDADLLQDPLIRSLYTGRFCDYQKYQLKKILEPVGSPGVT
jgi:hypothetical protein